MNYCNVRTYEATRPGLNADSLIVDLRKFNIDKVIAKGRLVVDNSKMTIDLLQPLHSEALSSRLMIPTITQYRGRG